MSSKKSPSIQYLKNKVSVISFTPSEFLICHRCKHTLGPKVVNIDKYDSQNGLR